MLPESATLIVIDVQQGFDQTVWGRRNNPQAEDNIGALIAGWRRTRRPLIFVRHHSLQVGSPLTEGTPGAEFKDVAMPLEREPVITKHVNSAFIGTDLEQRLRRIGTQTLVVVGFTTPHCCSTTIRMAGNLGFAVYAVADAMAAFERQDRSGAIIPPEVVHTVELAVLDGEFATVVDTAEIMSLLA